MHLFKGLFKQSLTFQYRNKNAKQLFCVPCGKTRCIATFPCQITLNRCTLHNEHTKLISQQYQVSPPFLSAVRYYGMKMPKKDKVKKKGQVKVELTTEEMEQVIDVNDLNEKMKQVLEKLKSDYITHLSVRTSAGVFDTLPIEFEGSKYPLNEIAQIGRKNPQLVVINVGAMPKAVKPIIEALHQTEMNLNPQQQGNTIYVTIPMVTKEHREQLSKSAKSLFLRSKDAIRDVQTHFIKLTKKQKGEFSDDLIFNVEHQIIAIAEDYISQAQTLMTAKQQELLGSKN